MVALAMLFTASEISKRQFTITSNILISLKILEIRKGRRLRMAISATFISVLVI